MNTDQIAAEAALSALGRQNPRFNLYLGQDPSFRQADVDFWTSEFKSAIEKALKEQRANTNSTIRLTGLTELYRAAHASEPPTSLAANPEEGDLDPWKYEPFRCAVCGRGTNEAGVLYRASRKGDTRPVIWICRDHFNYEDWKFVEDNDERLRRRAAHASEQDDTKRLEYLMRFFRKLILEFGFRGGLDRQQIDAAMRKNEQV